MQSHRMILAILVLALVSCRAPQTPDSSVPGPDAPFPATWTPTVAVDVTSTSTLVVQPTPTWDGTPPPPSEAQIPRVTPAKLSRELETGDYVVVDVRNLAAFKQAHVVEALHIPLEELGDRVGELDGNKTIVLYDLSVVESLDLMAAMDLYELGFSKIAVLDGGLQKWFSDGYAIEGTLLTPTPGVVEPSWTLTPLATSTPQATVTHTPTALAVTVTVTATTSSWGD